MHRTPHSWPLPWWAQKPSSRMKPPEPMIAQPPDFRLLALRPGKACGLGNRGDLEECRVKRSTRRRRTLPQRRRRCPQSSATKSGRENLVSSFYFGDFLHSIVSPKVHWCRGNFGFSARCAFCRRPAFIRCNLPEISPPKFRGRIFSGSPASAYGCLGHMAPRMRTKGEREVDHSRPWRPSHQEPQRITPHDKNPSNSPPHGWDHPAGLRPRCFELALVFSDAGGQRGPDGQEHMADHPRHHRHHHGRLPGVSSSAAARKHNFPKVKPTTITTNLKYHVHYHDPFQHQRRRRHHDG